MEKINYKNKYLIEIIIVAVLILVLIIITVPTLKKDKNENSINSNNSSITKEKMSFTTNKGNIIDTEYKDIGKFFIKLPKEFKIMDEETLNIKYPSNNKPRLVYTNEDASINVAFNLNGEYLNGRKLSDFVEVMKKTFEQMDQVYYSYDFELDGTKLYTLKMVTQAIDTEVFNYMVIFELNDQIMIINFNCTKQYMDEWQEVGEFIINSIKFK